VEIVVIGASSSPHPPRRTTSAATAMDAATLPLIAAEVSRRGGS
jgi:hypothetical protein